LVIAFVHVACIMESSRGYDAGHCHAVFVETGKANLITNSANSDLNRFGL
jgi:hypothetical protein